MHKEVLRHKYHMKLLGEMFVRKKYKYSCLKDYWTQVHTKHS